jgi:peptide deformylase|tara:strand:- start:7057 stop:7689 length:633 start_codon:yes stop_codon:yes gene_type:complete
MTILPIRLFPDPILRQKTKKIEEINKEIIEFAYNMLETMQSLKGVGLAAPQVGKLIKLITIQVPENKPMIMINPKIDNASGTRKVEEGCLSVPGFTGLIERSMTIDASYLDLNKSKIKLSATELLSQAIEHEIDHLNGIVYLDHLKSHDNLYKTGVTPNQVHWHDVGYKIFINKDKSSKDDLLVNEVIETKIKLSEIKSDSSIDEASVDI